MPESLQRGEGDTDGHTVTVIAHGEHLQRDVNCLEGGGREDTGVV